MGKNDWGTALFERTRCYLSRVDDTTPFTEGAKIQLNPTLDFDLLNLNPLERIIAQALQEYGMILTDNANGLELEAVSFLSYEKNPSMGCWKPMEICVVKKYSHRQIWGLAH